jgi:hypothetical protein
MKSKMKAGSADTVQETCRCRNLVFCGSRWLFANLISRALPDATPRART